MREDLKTKIRQMELMEELIVEGNMTCWRKWNVASYNQMRREIMQDGSVSLATTLLGKLVTLIGYSEFSMSEAGTGKHGSSHSHGGKSNA